MTIYAILLVELMLALELRFRLRTFTAAETICWFVLASQLVYVNGDLFYDGRENWTTASYAEHPMQAVGLYAGMFLLFYLTTLGVARPDVSRQDARAELDRLARRVARYELPFRILVGLSLLGQMVTLRWDVAWSDHQYLLMKSTEAMIFDGPIAGLVQNVALNTGYISALFAALALRGRSVPVRVIWLAFLGWAIAYNVADASRAAFAMLTVFLVFAVSLRSIRSVVAVASLVALDALFFTAALSGRGGGEFGFSAVPTILASPFSRDANTTAQLVANLFQGIFVTADGLDHKADFALRYKLLSFSPLPGGIDGFTAIREASEIRLADYVPMSAITEAIKFGPIYAMLFLGSFLLVARRILTQRSRLGLLYFFASAFLVLLFVQSGAYPIRNAYRQLIYLYVLVEVLIYLRRGGARAQRRRPVRPRAPIRARPTR